MSTTPHDHRSRKLLLLGAWLLLLGLLTGLLVPVVANPRLGLASHIEGVLNGMLLLILGLLWPRLTLSERWRRVAAFCAIYGAFANWASMLVAAVLDAGAQLTVAAEGRAGSPLAEGIVNFGLASLTLAMLVAAVSIIVGLRNSPAQPG
jgi:hydroxylaminobenzene mutase